MNKTEDTGEKMTQQADGVGYVTDLEELLNKRLDSKLRPFIDVVMFNQEEIIQRQKKQDQFLEKVIGHDTKINLLIAAQIVQGLALVLHLIMK